MIIGFVGPRGHGKTLGMTERLIAKKRSRRTVLTNYGPNCADGVLDAQLLSEMGEDLQDCAMGIDEIHILLDSRRSGSKRNLLLSYFILQTRKRNVSLYYTVHAIGNIDKRLRGATDYFIFASKTGHPHIYQYVVWDNLNNRQLGRYFLDGRKYYNEYDTNKTITDFAVALDD